MSDTRIYKGRDGWIGETNTNVNGQDFRISTSKYPRGLKSYAMKCQNNKNGSFMFTSTDMFNSIDLILEDKRVTEKAIKEQHSRAIILFDQMVAEGKIQAEKKPEPEIGTILFLDDKQGVSKGSRENEHIVYNIVETDFGPRYETVERTSLELDSTNHPKPYTELFGSGMYFEPDYKFEGTEDELNNLVIAAQDKATAQAEVNQLRAEDRELERQELIAEGKKIINIPKDAESVIVAEYYNNDSDSMTDYFATSVGHRVYLAYSKSTRNNMDELIEAAKNFQPTSEFPDTDEYKNTHDSYYLPKYFFGTERWTGYKVSKDKYFDLRNPKMLDQLYEAAGRGDTYFPQEQKASANMEPIASADGIEIVDYSDKAIAVIGETKPLKDQLKEMGGRFNFRLKCGAGWIFPKTKEQEVKEFLNIQ